MSQRWRLLSTTLKIPTNRPGWWGVWDAIKSLVTGRPRTETYTFTLWVKGPMMDLSVTGPHLAKLGNDPQIEHQLGEG